MKHNRPVIPFALLPVFLFTLLAAGHAWSEVSLPAIFADHMVLQRDTPVKIWGKATPGEQVRVELNGKSRKTKADDDGHWMITLPPMPAGGPHALTVSGTNKLTFKDVLFGEVWIASGQSNMQWTVNRARNADLNELTVLRNPAIRTIRISNDGGQSPQWEVDGKWVEATPETVGNFSSVAYEFAEVLHAVLGVPIGIVDNAWGGSAAEAWVSRQVLIDDPVLLPYHLEWKEIEADYNYEAVLAAYEQKLAEWEIQAADSRKQSVEVPRKPRKPANRMIGQHRPGNLWNGRILPILPYTIRGVIWYQGETNGGRGIQYRTLFPTLISEWRKAWEMEFPFYWVQLADFREEKPFSVDDEWPVLREAQTLTLSALPGTGQAVIIDLGEAKDIHPQEKEEVGRRLARWALNQTYGFSNLACRSPEFSSWQKREDGLMVTFNHVGSGLQTFDTPEVKGFAILRDNGQWEVVEGEIAGTDSVLIKLELPESVSALRYAWANNPVCNLYSGEWLPATPFRTDPE